MCEQQWWYLLSEECIYCYLEGDGYFYLVWKTGWQIFVWCFIYGGLVEEEDILTYHQHATVHWSSDSILQLTGYLDLEPDHILLDRIPHSLLAQWIQHCLKGKQWAVERFASQDNGETVAEVIHQAQTIAMCDGSYKDSFVPLHMSWRILPTSTNQLIAVNLVPGITTN